MQGTAWGILGFLALAGCAPTHPVLPPPPTAPLAAQHGAGVQVSLVWSVPVDLDLYVTDPSLETVYFANPRSQTGGRLQKDVTCDAGEATRVEQAGWDQPPPGRYRVGVDFIGACKSEIDEAEFRVVVDVGGRLREKTGRLAKERFEPVVLEFDVP
jgi:hypothetical protein